MSKTANVLQKKKKFTAKRLAINGLLTAMFFALSLFSVEVAGIKITFDSLPVIIAAMLFGPVDAFLVGFIGAFLEQMMRYGFTATTLLWVIPPAVRGLTVGLAAMLFRSAISMDTILDRKKPYAYFTACLVAAMVTSCLNTLVYYIDAKLYGYYNHALIFGIFGVRILSGLIAAAITAIVAIPIIAALDKAKIVQTRHLRAPAKTL